MQTVPCPRCQGKGRLPDDRALGAMLREKRIARGLSLRAVAAKLKLSPPYISDLELGRRHWAPELRERYEALL